MGKPNRLAAFAAMGVALSAAAMQQSARADFTFVHITDTQVGAAGTADTDSNAAKDATLLREISAAHPAFVVQTGNATESGRDEQFAAFRTLTQGSLNRPLYLAPGSSDVRWNPGGKEGYARAAAQALHQSWDYQNVHFVLLDSTVPLQQWGHFAQSELDWLSRDLQKVGKGKPVILGFHHAIGRDSTQIDNEDALLKLVAPYNIRLILVGQGGMDATWNVNGIPVVESAGLDQGAYDVVEVKKDSLRVLRHSDSSGTTTPSPDSSGQNGSATATNNALTSEELVFLKTLKRPLGPTWNASVSVRDNQGEVTAPPGNLPKDSSLRFRLSDGTETEMTPRPASAGGGWSGTFAATSGIFLPGANRITVTATLPDKRSYQLPLVTVLSGANAVEPLWRKPLGAPVQSRAVRSGDTLYAVATNGALYALDPESGTEKWRFSAASAIYATPVVADSTVYIGSTDRTMYAINAADGSLKWKMTADAPIFASASEAQNIVCVSSSSRTVYGLNADNGAVVWTVPGSGMFESQPATDGDRFYLGDNGNYVRALDVKTGQEQWKTALGDASALGVNAPTVSAPALGGGMLFVTAGDGSLRALDPKTGSVQWTVNGNALGHATPLFQNGRLYAASLTDKGHVFCFDSATGRKIWDSPTGSLIYDASCAWGAGNVYVASIDGTVSALRGSNGSTVWQRRLDPGHVFSAPGSDETRVYITSMNGNVVALPIAPSGTATRNGTAAVAQVSLVRSPRP